MNATAAILTRTWSVGARTCTLTVPRPKRGKPVHACIEWSPSVPLSLSAAEWAQYRAGRDAAMVDLARVVRGKAAVLSACNERSEAP